MSGKRVLGDPARIRHRPTEAPTLRIKRFDYNDEEWPHPGENDRGIIHSLFAHMAEVFPPELRDGAEFLPPSAAQLAAMDASTELYVAAEQYLSGLEVGRRWTDPEMQRLYVEFLDHSLTYEDLEYVVAYAIKEHGA